LHDDRTGNVGESLNDFVEVKANSTPAAILPTSTKDKVDVISSAEAECASAAPTANL
jgi:hypothetical protein